MLKTVEQYIAENTKDELAGLIREQQANVDLYRARHGTRHPDFRRLLLELVTAQAAHTYYQQLEFSPYAQRYRCEFPDFVLDVAIPKYFEDTSWHNDAMPSWTNEDLCLRIFVDYVDSELKANGPDGKRFTLWRTDSDGFYQETLLYTDDWQAIVALIKNLTAEHRANPPV